ncbi:hypothetical protein QFC24_002994 [Naganishia onofrii]|uniref:Uncharacterized protein n=1 Tax=Naganishia onofrii TaxID=1851511 RepID=A0ACC2XKY4_9TREE|nr:hypothetical protein QFC24_002994 [Naganishia onofrii]
MPGYSKIPFFGHYQIQWQMCKKDDNGKDFITTPNLWSGEGWVAQIKVLTGYRGIRLGPGELKLLDDCWGDIMLVRRKHPNLHAITQPLINEMHEVMRSLIQVHFGTGSKGGTEDEDRLVQRLDDYRKARSPQADVVMATSEQDSTWVEKAERAIIAATIDEGTVIMNALSDAGISLDSEDQETLKSCTDGLTASGRSADNSKLSKLVKDVMSYVCAIFENGGDNNDLVRKLAIYRNAANEEEDGESMMTDSESFNSQASSRVQGTISTTQLTQHE